MADTYAPLTPSPTAVRDMYDAMNSFDHFNRVVIEGDDRPLWSIALSALQSDLYKNNTVFNPAYHRQGSECGKAWTNEARRIQTMLRAALRLY